MRRSWGRIMGMMLVGITSAAGAQTNQLPPQGNNFPMGGPIEMGAHDNPSTPALSTAVDRARVDRTRFDGSSPRPAVAADLTAGASVYDSHGALLGTLGTSDATSTVIVTETGQVAVPTNAFGRNKRGLMLGLTKQDFAKLIASAH